MRHSVKVTLFALLTSVLWLALLASLWLWWIIACLSTWSLEHGQEQPCDLAYPLSPDAGGIWLIPFGLALLTALTTHRLVKMLRSSRGGE